MRPLLRPALLAALAVFVVLSGCGGGGGASLGSLIITTDWTNRSRAIGGISEKVQLLNMNGLLVAQQVIPSDGSTPAGLQQNSFANLPTGNYHFHAELWSQPLASGTLTGTIDTTLSITGSASASIDVGNDATSVAVTPANASLTVQQSQTFFAVLKDANTHWTYGSPGGVAWSVQGGVGTVTSSGIFVATSAGPGSVVGTYTPLSINGAGVVQVSAFVTTTGKWTILIFLNAANDLDQFSDPNVVQMQKVAANANVRFVVQWKQAVIPGESSNPSFVGTRRYLITPSMGNTVVSQLVQDMGTGIDMGDPQTLRDFVSWATTYYPATRTCLVMWDHGNGWRSRDLKFSMPTRGVSYDDDTGNHIDTWDLAQGIGQHIDIIAWDSSLMQMAEIAYEIRSVASYVVGSEESPPGTGYPYDLVFAKFRDNPDDTTANLTKAFVDGMLQAYSATSYHITQSSIDTTKLPAVATAVSSFADQLVANKLSLTGVIPTVRQQAQTYRPGGWNSNDPRMYWDINDVCLKLEALTSIPALTSASQAVRTAVTNSVVWEGHNTLSPGSHGLAIDFSNASNYTSESTDYPKLQFGTDTHWPSWLAIAP